LSNIREREREREREFIHDKRVRVTKVSPSLILNTRKNLTLFDLITTTRSLAYVNGSSRKKHNEVE
jgi:hypothetical protein